jgi:uncharacterized protein YraI
MAFISRWVRLDSACTRGLIAAVALSSLLGALVACGDAKRPRRSTRVRAETPALEQEESRAEPGPPVEREPPREPPKARPTAPVPPPVDPPVAARAADENNSARALSFRVEGVAEDDVLNIRSKPDAKAPVLGSIPPETAHVEGLGAPRTVARSTWQRVRYDGVVGWANARFLRANAGGSPPPPETPAPSADAVQSSPLVTGIRRRVEQEARRR